MGIKSSFDEGDSIDSTLPFLESENVQTIGLKRRASTLNTLPWVAHGIALLLLLSSSVYVLSLGRPNELECARRQSTWCKSDSTF